MTNFYVQGSFNNLLVLLVKKTGFVEQLKVILRIEAVSMENMRILAHLFADFYASGIQIV